MQEKKSKRSILSGIFRRRKKGSNSSSSSISSSSSDSEEPPQRRSFLRRRTKKKEKKNQPLSSPPLTGAEERLGRVNHPQVTGDQADGSDWRRPGDGGYRKVRVVPAGTGSLGKEIQSLGIPMLAPQPGQLNRLGVSASHDSLPLSLGSWTGGGSHASLGYYSGGGMGTRSSSTDTISKKERRDALKARVERLRERIRDTSSDDEKASVSSHSMYGSESSLSKSGSLNRRSRAARTERFLRRKSYELETLRNETEKDRRNREAVQARIEEIQRVREFEAKRNKLNEERKNQSVAITKPRWSAKLVYQESSEYESSVLLRTPSVSPAASPHMKAKFDGHAKDGVVLRNKQHPVSSSVTVSLGLPSGTPLRRSFQDFEVPGSNTFRGHRSASYDSNINRNSFVMHPPPGPASNSGPTTNRSGLTPPAPPPRDRSRILSPCHDGRPMSFSFESLNQDGQRPNSSQSSMSNFTKGSSPSPSVRSVPAYLGPRANAQVPGPAPPLAPTRRSFSELELSQQQQHEARSGFSALPARPVPPGGYPNSQYRYTDQPPKPAHQNHYYRPQQQQQQQLQPPSQKVQYYTDQSPKHTKTVPISSVPPSPSSDYSSYMSDNSIKLQQANTAWRQKEQEIKSKVSVPAVSDSSRSNSPKVENGMASSPGRQQQQQQQQQGEGIYGIIETKKSRPVPISIKQAESLSSLSGQSDVSSPAPRGPDSDSSQGSLARDKKKITQTRPLSMVLEKAESGEKETPPGTPKARPQPPVRSTLQPTAQGREAPKENKMKDIIKHKLDLKTDKSITHKEVEDMFQKEKEKLQKSKCSNFEEALKELEEIYASLRLDSEDLMDGAERRDLPAQHQALRGEPLNDQKDLVSDSNTSLQDGNRTRSLSGRRAVVPDVKADDLHFRRCQQSTRNQPDVQKALQMTGSYLLVSPAHLTPSDLDKDLPKDPMLEGEPDVVYDDVSYRNIKQANSIKIIDPQPPFGIPLGPTTQASPNDYLHVTPKENYRPAMISRKQPDTTMDDLAFRNLRKDKGTKEVNTSELDEFLSEARTDSPRRRAARSASADRAQSMRGDNERGLTPRQVKHQNEARRGGGQKESMTDSEATTGLSPVSARHNPSWLERAHLLDPKWDLSTNNLSTSTETLTELSSTRAMSQPDIRQAIIREARVPTGGPQELDGELHHVTVTSVATPATVTLATITVPRLIKVHTVHSAPASPVILDSKPYRPLDSIFNNKAKPFYLSNPALGQQPQGQKGKEQEQQQQSHCQQEQRQQQEQHQQHRQQQQKQLHQQKPQPQKDQVDIAKLDALISTLSTMEAPDDGSDSSDTSTEGPDVPPPKDFTVNELKISEPAPENVPEPQTVASLPARKTSVDYEYNSAKANIEKAIRLSMALESYSSEGKEVCSRRRSAVDLPIRETSSHDGFSNSSTNILSLLSLNPESGGGSGGGGGGGDGEVVKPKPSEATPPEATPAKASTCTDRVESMLVVSQQVHGRARRSRSVPTSPRAVDKTSLLGKSFAEPLINEAEVSSDGEVECGSEHEGDHPSGVSASLTLPGQGGDTLSLPSSSTVTPDAAQSRSEQQTSTNQNKLIACEPQAAFQTLSSNDAHASTAFENVESEFKVGDAAPPPTSNLSSAAKAPLPPVRLSSLPPSPTVRGAAGVSRSSAPPSPVCGGEVREEAWTQQRARGASEPRQRQVNGASDSESEASDDVVRAGSLPPAQRPPTYSTGLDQSRGLAGSAEPRSCVQGEGGELAATGQDSTCFQSLVAACYLLACVTQMAGVDLIAAFGLLLAMASVFITFAR